MAIYLGSTFSTYNYYVKNTATALNVQANDPMTKRNVAYFEANIGKVKTADEFVNNYQLFTTAMEAFGLQDMAHAKAYMKKVLESDLTDKNSFANKLADERFANFAKAFSQFNPSVEVRMTYEAMPTADITKLYLAQSMENTVGQEDQGVKLALYFRRNASTIKSAYTVIGDAALWKVVQTVYGFPESMGKISVEQQKKIVDEKFKAADMQDPVKVDHLLKRFTAIWDATQNVASNPILELFNNSSVSSGVSSSLMNLKYGG